MNFYGVRLIKTRKFGTPGTPLKLLFAGWDSAKILDSARIMTNMTVTETSIKRSVVVQFGRRCSPGETAAGG